MSLGVLISIVVMVLEFFVSWQAWTETSKRGDRKKSKVATAVPIVDSLWLLYPRVRFIFSSMMMLNMPIRL